MDAPTNIPAETTLAATIEAITAPSGIKMFSKIRQTKRVKLQKYLFFQKHGFLLFAAGIGIY